jgi:hypothetical protein
MKSFEEMMKIDVTPYCDYRKARDDENGVIKVPYLNWAVCKKLLHENGAKKVVFSPLLNEHGSSLFHAERIFGEEGKTNQCYEVGVHVVIDDLEFDFRGPLMNGSNPVRDNSISQQRVWNCQARLFVKGVAMYTGLGFSLWLDEEKAEAQESVVDDLEFHDVRRVKERIERLVTIKLDGGLSLDEIAKGTEVGTADDVRELLRQCVKLYNFEGMLRAL